jgi:hypothetical protein
MIPQKLLVFLFSKTFHLVSVAFLAGLFTAAIPYELECKKQKRRADEAIKQRDDSLKLSRWAASRMEDEKEVNRILKERGN